MKLSTFQKELELLSKWANNGCSNHGCRINPPKGMGTNSICQCTPRAFAGNLLWLASELEKAGKYGEWDKEDEK